MTGAALRWFVLPALALVGCLLAPQMALAGTLTPAACNKTFAAGEEVTCDVDAHAERVNLMVRLDGSAGATDLLATVTSIDAGGQATSGLLRETSAMGSGAAYSVGTCSTGTGRCGEGSLLLSGAPLRVKLRNNTAAARAVSMLVHVPELAAVAAPSSVSVTNWPATQQIAGTVDVGNFPAVSGEVSVSNFPATQDVNCVDGCAGAGGGGGEVALVEGDAQRLDLIWVGIFLMGGISLGMTVGSWLKRDADRWTFPRG